MKIPTMDAARPRTQHNCRDWTRTTSPGLTEGEVPGDSWNGSTLLSLLRNPLTEQDLLEDNPRGQKEKTNACDQLYL